MKNNIALIGFMGTGKTVVGKMIAERLGWHYIDTDKMIEDIAGKDIPKIFREDGEKVFRNHEIKAVKMASHMNHYVIATGGGVVLNEENVSNLHHTSDIVLLSALPDVIYERVKDDNYRPLLQVADPLEKIKDMLLTRLPLYIQAADFNVDTSNLTVDQVVDVIFKELEIKS